MNPLSLNTDFLAVQRLKDINKLFGSKLPNDEATY